MTNAAVNDFSFMAELIRANADLEKYGNGVLEGRWLDITRRRGKLHKRRTKNIGPTFPPGSKQAWLRKVMSDHHRKGNLTITAMDIRVAADEMKMPNGFARAVIKHMGYLSRSDNAVTIHSLGIYSLSEKYRV